MSKLGLSQLHLSLVNVHLQVNDATWRFIGKGTYERDDHWGSFLRIDVSEPEVPFSLIIEDRDSSHLEISDDPTGQAEFLLRVS